ncbi:phospholipase [Piscibacillus halophilus]|uniref:Coat protein VP1 n=1 Tax=Piscibacillus halophilus TaxID=571933 RepID=A0A1H9LEV1_9BACI|nr:phospholipase [Piscibacillus halophilus]SER09910.1 coat protein VP1 [Piscibacillus halophilus]
MGFCVFPGYRYCGPGCSGPGAPINRVDAACRAHDQCYRSNVPRARCDQEFMRRLQPLIHPHTREGRHARTIYNFMKLRSRFNRF